MRRKEKNMHSRHCEQNFENHEGLFPLKGKKLVISKKPKKNVLKQNHCFKSEEVIKSKMEVSDYQNFINQSKKQGKSDYPSIFSFLKIQQQSLNNFNSIDPSEISALNCSRKQLISISTKFISKTKFSLFYFGEHKIEKLITKIAQGYNTVSYHNFSHGFNLMQLFHKCVESDKELKNLLSSEQMTIYLISSLAHDLGHPGTNNQFEVKTKSSLARQNQNESVLEKMHLQRFLKLMRQNSDLSLIEKSSNPSKTKIIITEAILATDISKHFLNLQILKKEINVKNKLSQSQKRFVVGQIIHACDIGNPTLQFKQYLNWASLLTYQFNEQAKKQQQLNLQPEKYLFYENVTVFFKEQQSFIQALVLPLWKEISNKFPLLEQMVRNIQENLLTIEKQQKQMNL